MPNYSKNDVVLIRYPFTDFADSKVRPAAIVSATHISEDVFIVPLTSKNDLLLPGEFVLEDWNNAGLHIKNRSETRNLHDKNRFDHEKSGNTINV